MKKTIVSALILSVIPLVSTSVSANTGGYISGGIGSSWIKAKDLDRHWFADADDDTPATTVGFGSNSKTVFSGNVAVGYDFNTNFDIPLRTELAFTARGIMSKNTARRDVDFGNGDAYKGIMQDTRVRMQTLMVNSYYDFHNSTQFTPYVMAGVGVALNRLEATMLTKEEGRSDETLSKKKTNFAWAVGTGVDYSITNNLSADIGVSYVGAGKIKAFSDERDQYASAKLSSIDMLAGVRYSF